MCVSYESKINRAIMQQYHRTCACALVCFCCGSLPILVYRVACPSLVNSARYLA